MVIFLKIHMLGIKGSGMSALAIILRQLGHTITGSDLNYASFTQEELEKNGICCSSFNKDNLNDIDLLVVGHKFIDSDNIELIEARNKHIKIIEYNECLANLIANYYSIAVCGSNGKTTTTGLLACILDSIENTTYLIGNSEGKGNKNSKYFVFEACEHKKHFLKYFPNMILVNNIDYDHVDFYKSEEEYVNAFMDFINQSKDKVIVNADDVHLKDLNNVICFGIDNKKMFYADNINYDIGTDYDLYYKQDKLIHIHLKGYGKYLVYDSLAAITCAISLGIEIKVIANALKKFNGVKQRFKETIINDDVYIEDYAHHPSKIRSMIEAVKTKYPNKKIIAFYRPDRIPRLDYFSSSFAKELLKADKAYILPFINNTQEEKTSINQFIKNNPKVKLVTERLYKQVNSYRGVVYLAMSSKDISEVKEKILKYKGD